MLNIEQKVFITEFTLIFTLGLVLVWCSKFCKGTSPVVEPDPPVPPPEPEPESSTKASPLWWLMVLLLIIPLILVILALFRRRRSDVPYYALTPIDDITTASL